MAVNEKRVLYVGGLSDEVDAEVLADAFRPFGDVVLPVNLPKGQGAQGAHKGFGFVEMEQAEDALAAIENMNGAELFGRVLKVNIARPEAMRETKNRAVWDTKTDA